MRGGVSVGAQEVSDFGSRIPDWKRDNTNKNLKRNPAILVPKSAMDVLQHTFFLSRTGQGCSLQGNASQPSHQGADDFAKVGREAVVFPPQLVAI